MANISLLKTEFDKLPVDIDNMMLYEALLYLDISDFKPVMEELLTGRIDIEDTRPIFYNTYVSYYWLFEKNRQEIKDVRLSKKVMDTIQNNIISKISGDEKGIIREGIIFPDLTNMKIEIANEYFERTGNKLTNEEIDMLLPVVNTELFVELSLINPNANKDKEFQNIFADLLASTPTGEF